MSTTATVFHGAFGRVCLYAMSRTMVPHVHREGHLIFHIKGPPGEVVVDGRHYPLSNGQGVAISPWQGHYYRSLNTAHPTLALVLYIRPSWFLDAGKSGSASLRFGRVRLDIDDRLSRLIGGTADALLNTDDSECASQKSTTETKCNPVVEDCLCSLTQSCFDQSWLWLAQRCDRSGSGLSPRDFRVRNALKLLRQRLCDPPELDVIAREVGLSRPHFYKLFRQQVGVTPNLYVNALRMERAIYKLSESRELISDIGLDLGFSSQASFSRFFIANGVVPPSTYRRSVNDIYSLA